MKTRRGVFAFCLSASVFLAGSNAVAQSLSVGGVGHAGVTGIVTSGASSIRSATSSTQTATTAGGLTIVPTFDSTITANPNAAAIESSINAAIGVLESLFSDPVTVSIYFRYSSTQPDGQPTSLANSSYGYYRVAYGNYITALRADTKTANDATALGNLPGGVLATNADVTAPLGRALGLNAPGFMDSRGNVNTGGTFDGIVTLNTSQPIQFSRAGGISGGSYDAQRLVEHEMDEILGLGSILPATTDPPGTSAIKPEDLFRYSSPGVLSLTISASASSYFSINGGATDLVGFDQQPNLDYGDWLSPSCPVQATAPLVQYASTCAGTAADVSATSPEGIALDVVGYDLRSPGSTAQTITFNPLGNVPVGIAPFTINATASSGLAVTFNSTTPLVCTVSGSTVTIVGTGTCSITANQAGNASFAPAVAVTRSFAVLVIIQSSQTITFPAVGNKTLGTGTLVVAASASSGLAVIFTSNSPAVCTLAGAVLTLAGVGTCSITASQPGNATYSAALAVTQTFNVAAVTPPPPLQLITVAPCRIMDTRNPSGVLGGPFISGGTTRAIPVPSSACGVPANAAAYSLNFTVVPRAGTLGYLSVWPAGQTQPLVSTLNSPDGSVLANAAIVPAGAAGAVNAFATNDADLIVDINGYFVPPAIGTLQFFPLTPCRVLDTRNPSGTFGGPFLAGGSSRSFPVPSSACGVPASALAYAFNVTVVPHGGLGFVTAWPTGQPQPVVSTLNSYDGAVLANAAIVPAGTSGSASFFASNDTDLVVDINGYFARQATGGLNFHSVTPCRLVDTRPSGAGTAPRVYALSEGPCELPGVPTAQAYSLNITVVPQGPLGYLSTWAAGAAQPLVSTLNGSKGQVIANAAIVPAGGTGSIDVYATNPTDVIIDTNGYFGP